VSNLKLLGEGLSRNTSITKLCLKSCRLAAGASLLKDVIRSTINLEALDLSEITGLDRNGLSEILAGLYRSQSIKDLNLSYLNILGDVGGKSIKDLLRRNRCLTTLNVSRNTLFFGGATHLAEAIRVNKQLINLDLGACVLEDDGAIAIVESLRANKDLTSLRLSKNRLTVRSIRVIATSFRDHQALSFLSLSGNNIGLAGADVLAADFLKHNKKLEELRLSRCGIKGDAVAHIFQALEVNHTLRRLNILQNDLGQADYCLIASILPRIMGLRRLVFSWGRNLSEVETTLISALEQNTSLINAGIGGGRLQEENMNRAAFYLTRNRIRLTLGSKVALGLWPLVLEKLPLSAVFYCLREKPSLVASEDADTTAFTGVSSDKTALPSDNETFHMITPLKRCHEDI